MEILVNGKYNNDCKIFAKTIENEALSIIYSICDCPAFKDQKIRIMPDVHQGAGIAIGFSSTIDSENPVINPSHVGVDIGCTVTMIKINEKVPEEKYALLEHKMKKEIPMGFSLHDKSIVDTKAFFKFCNSEMSKALSSTTLVNNVKIDEKYISKMLSRIGMDEGIFWKSLGTIGGGNHYLEYDEDSNNGWFSIHCGSRNFGLKVAKYWMNVAKKPEKVDASEFTKAVDYIKETYPKSEWNERIKNAKIKMVSSTPNGYLSGDNVRGYLIDMVIAQAYAQFNHRTIIHTLENIYLKVMKHAMPISDIIMTTHNYIDFDDMIIRKGAVAANYGQKLVIPMNMRDGVLICVGKGNEEWNCTAPHGAGRLMSRSKAKENLSMEEFNKTMEGIYTTSVSKSTIDESPMAYKPMEEIVNQIEPTVQILEIVKPKINIKACD